MQSQQYGQQQGGYPPQGGPTVVVAAPVPQQPVENFIGQIIFSCITLWYCCCPLGLAAFIIAMLAQNKAPVNKAEAHRLGVISYVLSGIGLAIGLIIIITFTAVSLTQPRRNKYNYP